MRKRNLCLWEGKQENDIDGTLVDMFMAGFTLGHSTV